VPQKLIPTSLPLYFQCLSVPVEWGQAKYPQISGSRRTPSTGRTAPLRNLLGKPDPDLLEVRLKHRELRADSLPSFDPWEKRNEFFRLKSDDLQALLKFLNRVGLFEKAGQPLTGEATNTALVPADRGIDYEIEYAEQIGATHIWRIRKLLKNSLKNRSEVGDYADFQVRILRVNGQPRVVLTTATFLEALLLTLTVDRVLAAKVQKCARPDCGILFAVSSGHERKYCERYCAHIESVRRDRERKKKAVQHKGR